MREYALGKIVAERVMVLEPGGVVTVRIGVPVADEAPPHTSACPWQIEGIGSGRVRAAFGEDSVQSLWLALQIIGATLYASDEYKSGRLKAFPESEAQGDLGLPVPENVRDLLPDAGGASSSH